jgi:ABC-type amino acid transport substrate-binding protein
MTVLRNSTLRNIVLSLSAVACLSVISFIADLHPAVADSGVTVPEAGKSRMIDAIKSAGKLRSAVAVALPIVGQDPNTSEYFGVGVEIPRRVAEALGVEAEIIPAGWDVMIAGLQSGRWDMVTGGLYATPARLEVVNMVTYDLNGFCYAVLKDNANVNALEDLDKSDIKIGTYTGTGTLQSVSKAHPNAQYDTVVQGPGQTLRVDELIAGRFDVAPFDSPIAAVLEAKYPNVKIIPGGAAGCMKAPDVPTPVGLAIPKDDEVFKEFIAAVIKNMQDSGEMAGLFAKFTSPEFMKIAD